MTLLGVSRKKTERKPFDRTIVVSPPGAIRVETLLSAPNAVTGRNDASLFR